jgi:hypothetical protein
MAPHQQKKFSRERITLLLLLCLAIVIFFAQILQFTNSRRIDKRYSDLIEYCSRDIKNTNLLLIHSSNIQRNALNLLIVDNEKELVDYQKILNNYIALSEIDLKKLDSSIFATQHESVKSEIQEIKNFYSNYRIRLDTFLTFINNKQNEKAAEYRLKSLRPSFSLFQDLQKDFSIKLTKELLKESDLLTSYTNKSSLTLLVMGFSPIVFIILSLSYFGMVWYRLNH